VKRKEKSVWYFKESTLCWWMEALHGDFCGEK